MCEGIFYANVYFVRMYSLWCEGIFCGAKVFRGDEVHKDRVRGLAKPRSTVWGFANLFIMFAPVPAWHLRERHVLYSFARLALLFF